MKKLLLWAAVVIMALVAFSGCKPKDPYAYCRDWETLVECQPCPSC